MAVPLREVQQVADLTLVTHAPASLWRRRAVWVAATVAVLALGVILFSGGFPESLVIASAKPFNAFSDWVITHQRTNPLFVHFLVPLKNGINSTVDRLQLVLSRMTWLGVTVTVGAIAGVLAGWRMAIAAAAGFIALGLLGLWNDSLITLTLVLVSVGVALAIGIPVGIAIGCWRPVRHLAFPPVEILRPIPPIAWIPLSVLFFVHVESQIVFLTFYGAFFPIVYNTIAGVGAIDTRLVRAARSLGASEWHVFRYIVLPGTMPQIFTGLSVAVGVTWLMVVAAEMIAARGGLGYLTWEAYTTFNYPMIFVGMSAIGVLGALSSALLRWINRRVMPWRRRF